MQFVGCRVPFDDVRYSVSEGGHCAMKYRSIVAVLLLSASGLFISSKLYAMAMDRFAQCSFLVHAVALLLVVVAVQFLAGRGHAPFVYSRF